MGGSNHNLVPLLLCLYLPEVQFQTTLKHCALRPRLENCTTQHNITLSVYLNKIWSCLLLTFKGVGSDSSQTFLWWEVKTHCVSSFYVQLVLWNTPILAWWFHPCPCCQYQWPPSHLTDRWGGFLNIHVLTGCPKKCFSTGRLNCPCAFLNPLFYIIRLALTLLNSTLNPHWIVYCLLVWLLWNFPKNILCL